MPEPGLTDRPWRAVQPDAAGLDGLLRELRTLKGPLDLFGLEGGGAAWALAGVSAGVPSLLVVTPDPTSAESLAADLRFFLGPRSRVSVSLFPPYAHLPFGRLPVHPWTVAQRVRCLWSLSSGEGPVVAVVPVQALLHRTLPRQKLGSYAELLLEGEEVDREGLIHKLAAGGYNPTALVEEPGDMAVRGGIVDVYGPQHEDPLRLEFFGDFVDSLRLFRPHDQRSVKRLKESILLPMSEVILDKENLARGRDGLARLEADPARILELREPLTTGRPFPGIDSFLPLFYDRTQGLWDYLDQGSMVCLLDPAGVEKEALAYLDSLAAHQSRLAASQSPHLPLEEITFSWAEASRHLQNRPQLRVRPLEIAGPGPSLHFRGRPASFFISPPRPGSESVLAPLVKTVRDLKDQETTPWLVCRTGGQIKRLTELLDHYGLKAISLPDPPGAPAPAGADLLLSRGSLNAGFSLPAANLVVLTEEEALGQARVRTEVREAPPPAARLASFTELNPGDLVVHVDHGIGRFVSLVNLTVDGRWGDFILLEYKGRDKLYVPADRLDKVQKYAGPEGKPPPLDRLGGQTWIRTKSRVRRKLVEIVRELVELYAVRQVKEGFSFSGRDEMFREFEAAFDYDETPDQASAIEDVLADMGQPRPMDRLVCGDVGYGKTEVALRAAFKAVLDGKQVALLVPTTVLAEQHGETFTQRMASFPVRVEVLSRFKAPAAQKKILANLEKGLVDVVVGTHRLLSKDVIFANLGLVIVDEEHRFGVAHKEKLKELRQTVDVLALTATPIPRTLQMSLFNIRDLSVINTPPRDRHSITTYLSPFDPAVIQEAIGRELMRNGQVFFVHNRVQDILKVTNLIQKLVPTARVEAAHGQMSERVLEKVMHRFVRQEVDILVCTTIIESGLDIPSANTIIINRADKLGLAQIYQLRGRVGRSAERAYAYLLIPSETALSRDAQKRLKVMMDFSHLGAGFQIAMHDLQIRGGGNLLGRAQSGNVIQVGYEMYLALMEQAVAEIKGETPVERIEPELRLPVSAFIPAEYVAGPDQRLVLYRRLSAVEEEEELEELKNEMIDRFGPLPREALSLMETIRLKMILRRVGVSRLDAGTSQAALTFHPSTRVEPAKLVALVRSAPKRFKLTPDQQLVVFSSNPLAEARKVLDRLLAGCN